MVPVLELGEDFTNFLLKMTIIKLSINDMAKMGEVRIYF